MGSDSELVLQETLLIEVSQLPEPCPLPLALRVKRQPVGCRASAGRLFLNGGARFQAGQQGEA
jgi:hypothetical protein